MSNSAPARAPHARSELSDALAACRGAFIGTALISGMSNILMLSGAMFMLEVYDRVLPSRSTPTLVGLTVLVGGLFAALGAARRHSRPHPGAHRRLARRGAFRPRLRHHGAAAAARRRPRRRQPAAARSRRHPLLSFRSGPGGAVRPALDPALSGGLLHLPSADRPDRAGRRDHSDRPDHPDGNADAGAGARGAGSRRCAQQPCRRQPPQRRGAHRHGHVRPHGGALGRGQPQIYGEPAAHHRRRRRARRHLQGVAHDAAIRRAGGRRLSRHPSGSDRRHHHRRLDPERARAGAGRSRHRQLARLCRRPPELAAAEQVAGGDAGAGAADSACTRRRAACKPKPSARRRPASTK